MRIVVSLLFVILFSGLFGQEVYLDFDACVATNNGALADPVLLGSTGCECGVENESLSFEGTDGLLEFDTTYTSLFQKNFTLSFYFMVQDDATGINDIFSVSSQCLVDSSFTIKYFAQESVIRVQIARDFDLFVEMDAILNKDQCWHQLVVVREDENYSLYLDGAFQDNGFTNGVIRLDPNGKMKFANSPCQPFGEVPFLGRIDEFKIYERALSVEEIFSDYIRFDQVLTSDTTIFSGTSVAIRSSESCADLVSWFPSQNVVTPTDLQPVISPDATTLYNVSYDYGICRGRDSITIAIIDSEEVDCENLLIPNAFTPNNDGLNDQIGISNSFIIEQLQEFEIFDRWGEKVFETDIKTEMWDGQFKNQPVNSNVFLYKVDYTCKGEAFVKTGSFSILR